MHTYTTFSKLGYDVLGESSPVPSAALCPAEKLHWNISPELAEDIQSAKRNLDRYNNNMRDVWVNITIVLCTTKTSQLM